MKIKKIIGFGLCFLILLGFLSIPIFQVGLWMGLLADLIIIIIVGVIIVATGLASGAL